MCTFWSNPFCSDAGRWLFGEIEDFSMIQMIRKFRIPKFVESPLEEKNENLFCQGPFFYCGALASDTIGLRVG